LVAEWLLIETFGGREPTVLAVGSSTRNMVPLEKIMRTSRTRNELLAVITRVVASGEPVLTTTTDGQRRIICHPLLAHDDRVHGVFAWVGPLDEDPPPRNPAGAWTVNVTTLVSTRSDDLLGSVYGIAPEKRQYEHSVAQLFNPDRLTTNDDEAKVIALIVGAKPGGEHQATWTVTRDDGVRRAGNFACRYLEERNAQGGVEVVSRGITHDIGPAETTTAAPPVMSRVLAQRVVEAEQSPNRWRAIVDPHTMRLVRWLDSPVPGIAWRLESSYPPGIHRRDLSRARRMADALAAGSPVTSELRFRTEDGGWMRLSVTASLMTLPESATVALVALERPGEQVRRID
jgi:Domain of unknown function (DUF5593)